MEGEQEQKEQWAIVELMGHVQTAGRISRPSDWGGLLRVDVPAGEGYRSEFYGMAAIYAVKLVSREIARAYAVREPEAMEYNAPIVTRGQYDQMREQYGRQLSRAQDQIRELERRLTSVNALPAGDEEDFSEDEDSDE